MDVEVLFSRAEDRRLVDAGLVARCLASAAGELSIIGDGTAMTLLIADIDEISRLHAEFFGDPSATDVVSFPSGEDPGEDGAYLGDVAVCVDVASEQAADEGHSTQREVLFLALHGLLHLLGYDDQTDDEREQMLALQTRLLESFEREARP